MLLYNLGIIFYGLLIRLAALKSKKAQLWLQGRKCLFNDLEKKLSQQRKTNQSLIWFHCASLGEFEQGRLLIEKFKSDHTEWFVLLSFFSPSGYQARKDFSYADYVCYMPLDTPRNARRFVATIKPDIAVFVKYEFWLNHINSLQKASVPIVLASGIFRADQIFFKWYGSVFRKALMQFTSMLVQDENSKLLLEEIGINNVQVCGDSRLDRVLSIAAAPFENERIQSFCSGNFILMAGSTWPEDERIVLDAMVILKKKNLTIKLVLIPHEVDESSINNLRKLLESYSNSFTFSFFSGQADPASDILVIDTIGMLAQIYRYATVAYIGGGFTNGIHSILEPAAYGLPIAFGPKFHKFQEAHDMLKTNLALSVSSSAELSAYAEQFYGFQARLTEQKSKMRGFLSGREGASARIAKAIEDLVR